MLHRLRRAAYHHDIAHLEYGIQARLAAHDAVAPDRADRGRGTARRQVGDAPADGPCLRRQDDAVQFFAKGVSLVERLRSGSAKILAQHAVAVAAYVVDGADHPRHRQLQQQYGDRDCEVRPGLGPNHHRDDVGEDDKPISGEKYRITLPDDRVAEGTLDARGFARVSGFEEGTCKVTFPDLDKEAWEEL